MTAPRRLVFWECLTVSLMVVGYAGYYLCRSDLSVALPLLIQEMHARGFTADDAKVRLGWIASIGVLAYALGKFPGGGLADFLGGRRNFLIGMAGSVVFTILFALGGGLPIFTLAWFGNRLIQSLGWTGMVKITSKWFSFSSYGTVMGVISLSYLFGDAAARQFLSVLIARGMGWRGLLFVAAGTLFVLLVLNAILLRESPRDLGFKEPPANPANLFEEEGNASHPSNLRTLLAPFFTSRIFLLVCLLSLGVTLIRETFNLWTPTYFTQFVGFSNAEAAQRSALFPLLGGVSVLLAGFIGDHLGHGGRAKVILAGLLAATVTLGYLAFLSPGGSRIWPVVLVALVALLILGPYSYLAGAIALDFGGKQGSATASGLIDGVGYLGGVLAGNSIASISVRWGWNGAFLVLAAVAGVSSLVAVIYLVYQGRAEAARIH